MATMTYTDGDTVIEDIKYPSHLADGVYKSTFVPTKAGDHTVEVTLTNEYTETDLTIATELSDSPYSVFVYPGQVDPAKCYTNILP